jgi:hypothetical protein
VESRIRYKKTNRDGILYSIRDLVSKSTGAKYRVKIDTKDCTYSIINVNSERYYHGGEGISNLHVLKRHIKKHLEHFGISFGKEIRDNSSRVPGKNCAYKKEDEI